MNNYFRTAKWLAACGKQIGSARDLSVQIGCHVEEFCELLECIRFEDDQDQIELQQLTESIEILRKTSAKIKSGWLIASIPDRNRIDALDAICDTEITGNGIAYLAGFDKPMADTIVLLSNDAKLVDGKPVILEGGKIGKPEGWMSPNLSKCV